MRDIILWELVTRKKAIVWWAFGSVVMTVVILALYPSIRDQAAQMNEVINQLPSGLRELKAGTSGTVDVGDPLSFINSQLFYATLPIIWIILAVTRGSGILGADERNHTLELLLARPISRTKLLSAKAISLVLELLVIGGITLATILILSPAFELHIGSAQLFSATLYTTLFSLSFGYIALCLQAASRFTRHIATTVAVVLGFGGYILTSLSGMTDWLDIPVKLFPYHYFAPLDILRDKTPYGLITYLSAVFVIGSILAIVGFRHRDIE